MQGNDGKFIWPGFGENSRVLEWIFNRTDQPFESSAMAKESPIGLLPANDAIALSGLNEKVDMKELFSIPRDFWLEEVKAIRKYFDEQVNDDLPPEVAQELNSLEQRINDM